MKQTGTTLAEILIALAVMAVIAVFTIPKVLESTGSRDEENWKRSIKQGVSLVEAAYGQYRLNNRTVPSTFRLADATPYLNYIRQDTVNQIDGTVCYGSPITCGSSNSCYVLPNGSVVNWANGDDFDGTTSLHALKVRIDPDGKVSGPAGQDPGKAVVLYLYYVNGKLRDRTQIDANTVGDGWGPESASSICDPNWWDWN